MDITRIKRILRKRLLGITIFLMLFALIVLAIAPDVMKVIGPGHVGVLFNTLGKGTETEPEAVYHEGLHFILPWNKLYIYDARIQAGNSLIEVITKEGLTIKVEISIRFHPNVTTIGLLHKYIGPDYVQTVIWPEISATARDIIALYDIDSLYSDKRVEIQRRISSVALSQINNHNSLNNIQPPPNTDFEPGRIERYILFDDLFIKNIVLPDSVKLAIENKIVARQVLLKYQYLIATEVREKERKVIEAQGIRMFEDTSEISILKWRGLGATEKLATSPNAKIILVGTGQNLPVILSGDTNPNQTNR